MDFDVKKFKEAKFSPRTKAINVSDSILAEFFKDDAAKEFVVRGLTGVELAICNEAIQKNAKVAVMLDALTGEGKHEEEVNKIREAIGITNDGTPAATAKQLEMLTLGCVSPEIELGIAVRINQVAPVEFQILVNEITKLTGLGSEIQGKSRPSGPSTTSS